MVRGGRKGMALFLAALLMFCGTFPLALAPSSAYAVDTSTSDEIVELQKKIEETSEAYNQATAKVEELEQQISENESRIDELEESIPVQQEKAASAVRAMYKMQQEAPGLLELIMNSQSLTDFLSNVQYVTHIQSSNEAEINRLQSMQDELEQTRASLSDTKKEAVEQQEQAKQALTDAQNAREEAQRRAEEQAAAEAAALAVQLQVEAEAAAAQQQASEEASSSSGESSAAGDSSSTTNGGASLDTSDTTVVTPTDGGVDWSSDKTAFVAEWSARIDAYLAGSPLAGTGSIFAEAAYDYGVDPRWSPAISNTESSKGAVCFKPHNAWGWGSSSWSSWDEAIRAHVAGLAAGYGYTISLSAAQKYCPPNAAHWYTATANQMNMI